MANPYLTFASANPFTIGVPDALKSWDGVLYYSTDAEAWDEWDGTTAIASAEHDGGQRIYMRGTGNKVITNNHRWILTGTNIMCNGNIENLLDYNLVADGEHPPMASRCYSNMFQECTGLTKAPELPATTLAMTCYVYMFYGCTALKLSETKTDEYPVQYRIPTSGVGSTSTAALTDMFANTGGTFTGTPEINRTYYGAWTATDKQTTLDPSSMLMGWLAGGAVASQRLHVKQ